MLIAVVLFAVLLFVVYRFEQSKKAAQGGGSGVSAFAKLAEVDGKIIALKIATEAKRDEALAIHKGLNEIHDLLG